MSPSLGLAYNSDSAPSALGAGWSIQGLSLISRGSKTLDQDGVVRGPLLVAGDALFLDGGRLIPIRSDSPKEIEYRTEVDSYVRIVGYEIGDDGPKLFRVWTKAGLIMDYGSSGNSRITRQDGKTLLWLCERITDTLGNFIRFSFITNGRCDYNLSDVVYTGNERTGLTPYASVDFEYDEITNPSVSAFLGESIVKDKRLRRIVSRYRTSVMKEYRLSYEDTPSISRFLLKTIQEFAADGRSYSPTKFTYSVSNPEWRTNLDLSPPIPLSLGSLLPQSMRFVDLDGDGRDDLMFSASVNGTEHRGAFLNTGNGWTEFTNGIPPLQVTFASPGQSDPGVTFLDVNGDGKLDLLLSKKVGGALVSQTWTNGPSGWMVAGPEFACPVPFSIDGQKNWGVFLVDLDGDKRRDLIWAYQTSATNKLETGAFRNSGTGWQPFLDSFKPTMAFVTEGTRTPGAFVVDADADGHPDLLYHRIRIDGTSERAVYLWTSSGWKDASSQTDFLIPRVPLTNGYSVKVVQQHNGDVPSVLISWRGPFGSVRDGFKASPKGWQRITNSELPVIAFAYGNDTDLGVQTPELDGDSFPDLIGWTLFPDGSYERRALLNTATGWKDSVNHYPRTELSVFQGSNWLKRAVAFKHLSSQSVSHWEDIIHLEIPVLTNTRGESQPNLAGGPIIFLNDGPNGFQADAAKSFAIPTPVAIKEKHDRGVRFLDFNGDGLSDMIFRLRKESGKPEDDESRAFVNEVSNARTNWTFAPEYELPEPTASEKEGDWGSRFMDVNGDALVDFICGRVTASGNISNAVYLNKGEGNPAVPGSGWGNKSDSFVLPASFVKETYGDLGARFVDLNSDGLIDIISSRRIAVPVRAFQLKTESIKNREGFLKSFAQPSNEFARILLQKVSSGVRDEILNPSHPEGDRIAASLRSIEEQKNELLKSPGSLYSGEFQRPEVRDLIGKVMRTDDLKTKLLRLIAEDVFGSNIVSRLKSNTPTLTTEYRLESSAWTNSGAGWALATNYAPPIGLVQDFQPLDPKTPNEWWVPELYFSQVSTQRSRGSSVLILDVNGDKLPDLVVSGTFKGYSVDTRPENNVPGHPEDKPRVITRVSTEVPEVYLNTGSGWVKAPSSFDPPRRFDEPEDNKHVYFEALDVNGDGLTDFVFIEKSGDKNKSETYLGTGAGWKVADNWKVPDEVPGTDEDDQGVRFMDVNGDGLADILVSRVDSDGKLLSRTYLNSGAGWVPADESFRSPIAFAKSKDTDLGIRMVDVNGDGVPDLLQNRNAADGSKESLGTWINSAKKRDLLTSVENGLGLAQTISYHSLADPYESTIWSKFYSPPSLSPYPIIRATPPAYAVRSVSTIEGSSWEGEHKQTTTYSYSNYRFNVRSGKPLGFEIRRCDTDTTGGAEVVVTMQEPDVLVGRTRNVSIFVGTNQLSFTTNSWVAERVDALPNELGSSQSIYRVKLQKTVSVSQDYPSGLVLAKQTQEFDFDSFGNATRVSLERSDGTKSLTRSDYRNDPAKWFLGRLVNSTVVLTGEDGSSQTRTATFDYDPETGLLTRETSFAGNPKSVTTEHRYDAYGNKTHSTSKAQGLPHRQSWLEFDSEGRFGIRQINALRHTNTFSYNLVFGVVTNVINPNGVSASKEIDPHGRIAKEIAPTQLASTTEYIFPPTQQRVDRPETVYGVRVKLGDLPPTITWMDVLGRPIGTISTGAQGKSVITDTHYDVRGRIKKASDPHFEGDTPFFTEMEYDPINRPIWIATPDGKTNFFACSGYSTTVTDKNGHTTTTETNIRKLTIRTTDAATNTVRIFYDVGDRVARIENPDKTVVRHEYNELGQRVATTDPDLGRWTCEYNAYGELVQQVDAKGQETRISYDLLGRIVLKLEADRSTSWEYDTAKHGVGALAKIVASDGYMESYEYDELGRAQAATTSIDGKRFTANTDLDEYNRVARLTYPTGFKVENVYDTNGFLVEVRSPTTKQSFWRGELFNEKGQVVLEKYGNGVRGCYAFDRQTGFLDKLTTFGFRDFNLTNFQSWSYEYDPLGNVLTRKEAAAQTQEKFQYDALDRLVSAQFNNDMPTKYTYGVSGNLTKKSDQGTYNYGSSLGLAHAVKSLCRTNGIKEQYQYDANGNMTANASATFAYTSANLPSAIRSWNASSEFRYNPSGNRYSHNYRDGLQEVSTLYLGLYERVQEEMTPPFFPGADWMTGWQYNPPIGKKPLWRKLVTNERLRHRHYIQAGAAGVVAIHEDTTEFFPVRRPSDDHFVPEFQPERTTKRTTRTAFLHRDALRSITAISDDKGALIERMSFDPWGKRREKADEPRFHTFRRGFTGHEHLDNLGLVHMNGRVYDPRIGRFISADPFTDGAQATQAFNRYTYVSNNPLRFIDPSGFGFLSSVGNFFGGIGRGIANAAGAVWDGVRTVANWYIDAHKAVGRWIADNWRTVAVVAVVVAVGVFAAPLGPIVAGMLAGAIGGGLQAGLHGGGINEIMEGVVMGAIAGALTGAASAAAGSVPTTWSSNAKILSRAGAYGVSGGIKSGIQGQDFLRGFATGALASGISSQYVNKIDGFEGAGALRVAAAASAGGVESVIGGGKFENGALTGAFAQLHTYEINSASWKGANSSAATVAGYAIRAVGYARALPATVAGLVVGGYFMATANAQPSIGNNGIQFTLKSGLFPKDGAAFTIGNAMIYGNTTPETENPPVYTGEIGKNTWGEHESVHTYQWGSYGMKGFLDRYSQGGFATPHTPSYNPLEAQ